MKEAPPVDEENQGSRVLGCFANAVCRVADSPLSWLLSMAPFGAIGILGSPNTPSACRGRSYGCNAHKEAVAGVPFHCSCAPSVGERGCPPESLCLRAASVEIGFASHQAAYPAVTSTAVFLSLLCVHSSCVIQRMFWPNYRSWSQGTPAGLPLWSS